MIVRNIPSLFFIITLITLVSCSTSKKTSSLNNVSVRNTEAKLDNGSVVLIPGEWTFKSQNKITHQSYYTNKDSVMISVSRNPMEKYPFHKVGMTDTTFVDAFFEWESNYYKTRKYETAKVEIGSQSEYIIWSVKGEDDVNALLLYTAKNPDALNFSVLEPKNLTLTQQKGFLIQMYKDNIKEAQKPKN